MRRGARIRVSIILPTPLGERKYDYQHEVDELLFIDALRPLPRTRELDPWSYEEGRRMREKRRDMAELISRQISISILHGIEQQDTDHGYTKEELKCV